MLGTALNLQKLKELLKKCNKSNQMPILILTCVKKKFLPQVVFSKMMGIDYEYLHGRY